MKPVVVKVGGSTLGSHDTALADIADLWREGSNVVVVHGGGAAATEWLQVRGVVSEFVDGLRATGADAIEVVVAVLAGLVNKQLVVQLNALGASAAGLSGADGRTFATRRADPRLGFVGEITAVDTRLVEALLASGYLPVLSPIGFLEEQPDVLMNINADTVAGALAAALPASDLLLLTDVPSVRGGDGRPVHALRPDEVEPLVASGVASAGMVPKLRACAHAAVAGVRCRIVDGREAHALRDALRGVVVGTRISG